MEAFMASQRKNFHGNELDVRLTGDQKVVIFHGPDLSTTTEQSGFIEDLTYSDLKSLNCGHYLIDTTIPATAKTAKAKPMIKTANKRKNHKIYQIPLFEQYLKKFGKNVFTNVEIKKEGRFFNYDLEKELFRILKKDNQEKRILISSFNWLSIFYIRKNFPGLWAGILVDKKQSHFWIPLLVWLIRPDTVHIHISRASEKIVRFLHQKHCGVVVWGVNDPERLRYCKDYGIDIAITDNMELMKFSKALKK